MPQEKTHCIRGHELKPPNLVHRAKSTVRMCKKCHAMLERQNNNRRLDRFTNMVIEEITNALVAL